MADYIGSDHTEVIITRDDVIEALEPVVALLGTYDITTIRASIGMYLVCKAIHEQTDIRVLLTGEISDELFGYKYTDFAPSARSSSGRRRSGSGSCTCTMCFGLIGASRSTLWRPGCPLAIWTLSATSCPSTRRRSATTTARQVLAAPGL